MFRSGLRPLGGDVQPAVITTVGLDKLLRFPQVYTKHQMATSGADPKQFVETGEWRGKTWRLAHLKYAHGAPYAGVEAETYVKELAAACYPHDVLVTLSADICSAMILMHHEDKFKKNVDFSAHCVEVHFFYPRKAARGAILATLARHVQNSGRTIGGTLLMTDEAQHHPTGLAPEYTMEQLYAYFQNYTRDQFNLFIGNAKLHKAAKSDTSLDRVVLTVQSELRTYVHEMNEAVGSLQKVDDAVQQYEFKDFLPDAYSLEGFLWDDAVGIHEQSIDDWLSKNTAYNYLHTTLILVGASGVGKSEFANVIARELSRRHGFSKFCSSKLLDSLGRLTLSGQIEAVGAFHFSDFELRTKLDRSPLSAEHVKGLLGPTESGGFDCRYHSAVMPKYRPRIWTLNSGGTSDAVDFEDWFKKQLNTEALEALSNRDGAWLSTASAHDKAIARRAFIVHVTDPLFTPPSADVVDDCLGANSYFEQGLALPPRY